MWELLQLVFLGHVHEWKFIEDKETVRFINMGTEKERQLTIRKHHICECTKCGKRKSFLVWSVSR